MRHPRSEPQHDPRPAMQHGAERSAAGGAGKVEIQREAIGEAGLDPRAELALGVGFVGRR